MALNTVNSPFVLMYH